MTLRKTKVICTLGPAVDNEEMIRKLIRSGMDAARFNFSHGSHEEHLQRLNMLKNVRDALRSGSRALRPSPSTWRRGIPLP